MNKPLILLFLISFSVSCGESKQGALGNEINNQTVVIDKDSINSRSQKTENINVIERYFPEELTSTQFDTLLTDHKLKISIKSSYLESYVTNEFESEGVKHIDKYRDTEHRLTITKAKITLIDTVLTKQNLLEITDQEFLDMATFHRFWFRKIQEDSLEFFGTITKPETDWTLPFYHYFDLKFQKLTLEPYLEEGI